MGAFQIDQHCAVSIRLDGTYIPPELRPLLQQQRPLHLHVTTQDAFSFESKTILRHSHPRPRLLRLSAFKRCVTTFLAREREFGQENWNINDQGVRRKQRSAQERRPVHFSFKQRSSPVMSLTGSKVLMFPMPSSRIWYEDSLLSSLHSFFSLGVFHSMSSTTVSLYGQSVVRIAGGEIILEINRVDQVREANDDPLPSVSPLRHESTIIRHLAANFLQKSMISTVCQCEMYHVNLILHQGEKRSETSVHLSSLL